MRWDIPSKDYYKGSNAWEFIHKGVCSNKSSNNDLRRLDFNKAVGGLHSMILEQVICGIGKKVSIKEHIEKEWNNPALE